MILRFSKASPMSHEVKVRFGDFWKQIYYLNDNHNTTHSNNCCAPFLNYRSGHLTNCFNLSWYAELMFQLSFANLHLVQFFLLSVVAYSEI